MQLLRWWINEGKSGARTAQGVVSDSKAYDDPLVFSLSASAKVELCRTDLGELVRKNICGCKAGKLTKTGGVTEETYDPYRFANWPGEYRRAFEDWQAQTRAQLISNFSFFAASELHAYRRMALAEWLRANPNKSGPLRSRGRTAAEIIKESQIYDQAVGGTSPEWIASVCREDLGALFQAKILVNVRQNNDSFLANPVRSWTATQQKAFRAWRDAGRPRDYVKLATPSKEKLRIAPPEKVTF
jgi:hypothetical protein